MAFLLAVHVGTAPAAAQLTTGTIAGQLTDQQGAAIPGAVVRATNRETGLTREDVSDAVGNYRLAALPVGQYDVVASLPGFTAFERRDLAVNIATTVALDIRLEIAQLAQTVTVEGQAPAAIFTRSSAVGEVVDLARIQGLPLNGRQFGNLVATVPGVGLGFHSDVSKNAQYSPQISGGNGRNINYIVDGGDNNDDTVGGLLQLFPLEAIQEFNVSTQRFNAEYGRANGAVLNVVTKSGTNDLRGSWFTLMRDDALNARTMTEQLTNTPKQPYRRFQYGGSVGGPLVRDRAHFFAAYERTQQDTKQAVNTSGIFPDQEGVFDVKYRQDLFTGKVTMTPGAAQYLSMRYARDHNSQPNGAGPRAARSSWTTSTNDFDSVNANHNWVIAQKALNEVVVQYSRFSNDIPVSTPGPVLMFPNNVMGGANLAAPQSTEQVKWQLRDDYSWTAGGFGIGHELRAGVNWIHEPRLYTATGQGTNGVYTMGTLSATGPVTRVFVIGGNVSANIPLEMYGAYLQDDWRVTQRLTVNAGVRWDFVSGMPIDQSRSFNFLTLQAAGSTGRFAGTLLEDFGQPTRSDTNNVQPRIGAVYDLRGDGRDILRGGWGIYTDFAYTNSNALTAAYDAGGGGGIQFSTPTINAGLRKSNGELFHVGDPLDSIAYLNTVDPRLPLAAGEVVSPLLEQPFTYQTNIGWSHELNAATGIRADYVKVQGRDLNLRVRPNTIVDGRRLLGDLPIQPNDTNFRVAISDGRSEYDALIIGLRRRMTRGVDVNAAYTLARATSDVGSAYDELATNIIQDVAEPFSPEQNAPSTRTDSRHQISLSAILQAPFGVYVAPIVLYRTALPVHTFEGVDLNTDGNVNDSTLLAYRFTGLNENNVATFETDGPCETVNCSRRAGFSQINLRVSRSFRIGGSAQLEAIGELFNVFNAKNPSLALTQRRILANGTANPGFMQPSAYAGDVGQPEQRVGQVGFRFTF